MSIMYVSIYVYIYIYVYMYIYMYIYICMYVYIQRALDRPSRLGTAGEPPAAAARRFDQRTRVLRPGPGAAPRFDSAPARPSQPWAGLGGAATQSVLCQVTPVAVLGICFDI